MTIIMTADDVKATCLDLSKAALGLFDIVDADGIDAAMENYDNILILKSLIDSAEEIRSYYERANIQRMLAMGVPPKTLLNWAKRGYNGNSTPV